ncbi:MAG TPA: ECF-type sigma factor [Longimicrobiales bacterium]|nr:ECF-type sigma factor [Longimicrobiales bacterium]
MQHRDPASSHDLTVLLSEASGGNVEALNRLFPIVYDELRRLAGNQLRGEREGHTLNTTALVHEAYVRLAAQSRVEWQNRAHFYGVAAQAMRRILVNYAEARRAGKRGGGAAHVTLEDAGIALTDRELDDVLAVHQALERLRAFNERGADIIAYRFFGGLTHEEIADVMGTSEVTVRRAWTASRSWLRRELRDVAPSADATLAALAASP